ncbi:SulP family sulfate permease [Bacilli bacterium PM5-3]|nr:SulP family sulfate permease [Bacilli bacterium PM5-3]MDH6603561.1 SulP family sulfate permease [Bacilli bacterium PM5-9]
MNIVSNYFEILKNEFKGYNKSKFSKDLVAGITVAAVALPLALAFGVGSGADATAGLITAIIAGIVIGMLSGTSFQISGPTGAMMAILIPLVSKQGINTLFAATLLAGIILVIAGIIKAGKFVQFIPLGVITGFTSGISIVIALGQLSNLFGIKSSGDNVISQTFSIFNNISLINYSSLLIGLMVILVCIFWPKKIANYIPGSLVSIVLATIVTSVFSLDIQLVGEIPQTIIHSTRLSLSDLTSINWEVILLPSISIAALCMIESLLSGVAGSRMKNEKIDANQELISQGIGNIIIPFFGGVPATAAIARTSVGIKVGAQTRLAGIIHAIVLILSIFLLAGLMSQIPLSGLAGVLIITAWRMNEWDTIKYLFSHKFKGAISKFTITLVITVVFDLTIAIAVGIIFSVVLLLIKMTDIEINIADVDSSRLNENIETPKKTKVVYITGMLFFGVSDYLENELMSLEDNDNIILSMRGVPQIDISVAMSLLEFCKQAKKENKNIYFTSLQNNVKKTLARSGIYDVFDKEHFFSNAKDAIMYISKK